MCRRCNVYANKVVCNDSQIGRTNPLLTSASIRCTYARDSNVVWCNFVYLLVRHSRGDVFEGAGTFSLVWPGCCRIAPKAFELGGENYGQTDTVPCGRDGDAAGRLRRTQSERYSGSHQRI